MTLSVTVERFAAILYPLKRLRLKTPLIVCSTLFTLAYNIPRFFEFTSVPRERADQDNSSMADTEENTVVMYQLRATELRRNPWYIVVYVVWMKFFLVEIIPYIVICALNAMIIHK